jgi:hypothetical protein
VSKSGGLFAVNYGSLTGMPPDIERIVLTGIDWVTLDRCSTPSLGAAGKTDGGGVRHGINGNKARMFACRCWGQKLISGKGLRKDVTTRRKVIVNLCNKFK